MTYLIITYKSRPRDTEKWKIAGHNKCVDCNNLRYNLMHVDATNDDRQYPYCAHCHMHLQGMYGNGKGVQAKTIELVEILE